MVWHIWHSDTEGQEREWLWGSNRASHPAVTSSNLSERQNWENEIESAKDEDDDRTSVTEAGRKSKYDSIDLEEMTDGSDLSEATKAFSPRPVNAHQKSKKLPPGAKKTDYGVNVS